MPTDSGLLSTHGTAVVIEDDLDIRTIVCDVLKQAGFDVHAAATGRDGVDVVLRNTPTVVTLDVGLPDIDGYEVLRRIRGTSNCYVIMLTARNDEPDILTALQAGADDYLTKPFRPRELRARIDALLRRPTITSPHTPPPPGIQPPGTPAPSHHAPTTPTSPPASNAASDIASDAAPSPVPSSAPGPGAGSGPGSGFVSAARKPGALSHGDLIVDRESWTVRVAGQDILLTRSEFDLLHEMLRSDGAVRTKAELVTVLQGDTHHGSSSISAADQRAVEVHIGNLRRKLSDHPGMTDLITTVRGVGYRITHAPV